MWIHFDNRDNILYQIKVYNAISDEPFDENVATQLRRRNKLKAAQNCEEDGGQDGKKNGYKNSEDDEATDDGEDLASPLQDYIVVPGQP
jgi:hypothetical protein